MESRHTARSAKRTGRKSTHYVGRHRARRHTRSVLGLALAAGLPTAVLLGGGDAPRPALRPAAASPAAVSAPVPPVIAVPAAARPAPAPSVPMVRRLVGHRSETVHTDGRSFTGRTTWYGPGFHGRRTANGERFNQMAMTAAHRTLPFGTMLRVCTKRRCVVVRINDRGPFGYGNVLDLSKGAARKLGIERAGVARVTATVVRSRTVRVPVYAMVPSPAPLLPAVGGAAAERLQRPDPVRPAPTAASPGAETPEIALVVDEVEGGSPQGAGTVGVSLAGLVVLAVMGLPAALYRRRRGLSFAPQR